MVIVMTEKDKILYVGYGFNGEPGLDSLLKNGSFDVVGVIATPLGAGRYRVHGKELPLELLAHGQDIPVWQTNENEVIYRAIKETNPKSVLLCVYNKILSDEILKSALSFFNVHHGCHLPRLRGSSNTEWAVRNGINKITISLLKMVPGLDEGDLYWEPEISITDDETIVDMRRKMNEVLRQNLGNVYEHILHPERLPELSDVVYQSPQSKIKATYACSIREEDSLIDWDQPALDIYNVIRSVCDPELDPAYTFYQGKQLKVWKAKMIPASRIWDGRIPGKPVSRSDDGVEVLTGDPEYAILLQDVEIDGKKMPAKEVITSIRNTLGLHPLELLKRIQALEQRLEQVEKGITDSF